MIIGNMFIDMGADLMKKSIILSICALSFTIAIILGYRLFWGYTINLQLSNEMIKVNIYDNIDLENYISKASDSIGKNLKGKVEISVECDEEDIINENNLYVKSIGPKVVTYKIENRNRTVVKKLVIKVITDPNDKGFKPNYDKIESESQINNDDEPNTGGDTNFSEEQLEYINSL